MSIGDQYGGPSYIGRTVKFEFSASTDNAVELVSPWTDGNFKIPFQKTSFSIKASGACFISYQASSRVAALAAIASPDTCFLLESGVYWRVDVNIPEQRFIGLRPQGGTSGTDGSQVRITVISQCDPALLPVNVTIAPV